jgi:methionine-rich copper-binding protein CopC
VEVRTGTTVVRTITTGIAGTARSTVVNQLTNGTAYNFRVRAVNAIGTGALSTASAAVTPRSELVAPAVTAQSPVANSTGFAPSANITVTFSEAVEGVTNTTFQVRSAAGTLVGAVVSRNGTTNQWILNPNANLANDTRYTVTLTGGTTAIRDAAGNALTSTSWTFLSGPAPFVSARTPADGATGVSRTANITFTASEAVQGVSATTFRLRNDATGAIVTAVVSRDGTTNRYILNPSSTLPARTNFTVLFTGSATGIRDMAGNWFLQPTNPWNFTTGS